MKKVLTILIIFIAALAISGCASRDQPAVTATLTGAPTITPSAVPTMAPNTTAAYTTNIDAFLADISGEGDESLPEIDIPTPSAE